MENRESRIEHDRLITLFWRTVQCLQIRLYRRIFQMLYTESTAQKGLLTRKGGDIMSMNTSILSYRGDQGYHNQERDSEHRLVRLYFSVPSYALLLIRSLAVRVWWCCYEIRLVVRMLFESRHSTMLSVEARMVSVVVALLHSRTHVIRYHLATPTRQISFRPPQITGAISSLSRPPRRDPAPVDPGRLLKSRGQVLESSREQTLAVSSVSKKGLFQECDFLVDLWSNVDVGQKEWASRFADI